VAPMALLVLPFDGTPFWVMICFLGAISAMKEVFLRQVLDKGVILSVNSNLNESTSL